MVSSPTSRSQVSVKNAMSEFDSCNKSLSRTVFFYVHVDCALNKITFRFLDMSKTVFLVSMTIRFLGMKVTRGLCKHSGLFPVTTLICLCFLLPPLFPLLYVLVFWSDSADLSIPSSDKRAAVVREMPWGVLFKNSKGANTQRA